MPSFLACNHWNESLTHKYFLLFLPPNTCLDVPWTQGGDLFDAIAEACKYSEREASRMMNDLSNALSYLHASHICHRDIKPENLLVCDYSWINTSAPSALDRVGSEDSAVNSPQGQQPMVGVKKKQKRA